MRLYDLRYQETSLDGVDLSDVVPVIPDTLPEGVAPGFTLTEVIDQFMVEGVVPDFLPADLGEDGDGELSDDGSYLVDPLGDLRSDPFEMMESGLMSKVPDDPTPIVPPVLDSQPVESP